MSTKESWEFTLPKLWAMENLAPLLRMARGPAGSTPDSVLAQVFTATFDAENPEADLAGVVKIRLALVPAKTVPKVYKLIQSERLKMGPQKAAGTDPEKDQ